MHARLPFALMDYIALVDLIGNPFTWGVFLDSGISGNWNFFLAPSCQVCTAVSRNYLYYFAIKNDSVITEDAGASTFSVPPVFEKLFFPRILYLSGKFLRQFDSYWCISSFKIDKLIFQSIRAGSYFGI